MDEEINDEIGLQKKIITTVTKRHEQLNKLKTYYDVNYKKEYKDSISFGKNLLYFEHLYNKNDYRLKCENILSLALSLGRVIDLNNSVKTILISLKIFEEHNTYLQNLKTNKNFITKIFEKNEAIPLTQNESIKERIKLNSDNNSSSFKMISDFYNSLNTNETNFYNYFEKYLSFEDTNKNFDDYTSMFSKIMSGSFSQTYKFYTRIESSFDFDYPSIIITVCDIFFMLYSKMMDKIFSHPNLFIYLKKLDQEIVKHFISVVSDDLDILYEFLFKKGRKS